MQSHTWVCQILFDLFTITFPVNTPRTKVLAVVGQEPVMIFAQSGASPLNRFLADIFRERGWFDPDYMACSETLDADFLHRSAVQRPAKSGVVHHLPITQVNAMVIVAMTGRDEMGAWQW